MKTTPRNRSRVPLQSRAREAHREVAEGSIRLLPWGVERLDIPREERVRDLLVRFRAGGVEGSRDDLVAFLLGDLTLRQLSIVVGLPLPTVSAVLAGDRGLGLKMTHGRMLARTWGISLDLLADVLEALRRDVPPPVSGEERLLGVQDRE